MAAIFPRRRSSGSSSGGSFIGRLYRRSFAPARALRSSAGALCLVAAVCAWASSCWLTPPSQPVHAKTMEVGSGRNLPSSSLRPSSFRNGNGRMGPKVARNSGEGLFDRFTRVVKANVNKALQGMEDPEKILDQAVDDMQQDLIKVRQAYAEVLATQRRQQTAMEQSNQVAEEWYRRASLAVEKGDDELAKEALSRRQAATEKSDSLKAQIEGLTGNVENLLDSVKQLEEKIMKAKEEKEQLIARARTAKTTAKVNEMLSDVSSTGSAGAFDRMKEKVEQLETRAEVSQGMLPEATQKGGIEDRFKQLESGNAVDDELAKLKGLKSLPAGGGAASGGAPGGSAGGGGDALDKELEAMRKKLKDAGGD